MVSAFFQHYYMFFVRKNLADLFPDCLSYNRFLELEARVSLEMIMFLQICCMGRCTGISFIDSTCIPVCHNKRSIETKFSKIMPPGAKARWAGILASNFISCATKEAKFLISCLLKQMWTTETRMYLTD